MPKVVIADTSCLIVLNKIQLLHILHKLYKEITGTLGVLVRAKRAGLIVSIKPVIEQLKSIKFRISLEVEKDILVQCKE